MINWLKKILGLNRLEERISEVAVNNNKEIIEVQKSIKEISITNNNNFSQLSEIKEIIRKILPNEQKSIEKNIEHFKIGGIDFNLTNDVIIDESWRPLNPDGRMTNLFSQITGVSTYTTGIVYTANGLYTATAKVSDLMTYNDGTLSSIVVNGNTISNHSGFINANISVFTPMIIFQITSLLTGQYYFNNIVKQLNNIQNKLNKLLMFFMNEKYAKLTYANNFLIEMGKRNSYAIEDFIMFDRVKYDLSVMRYEFLYLSKQTLNNFKYEEKEGVKDNLLNRAPIIKDIMDRVNKIIKNKIIKNSSKEAKKIIIKIHESDFHKYLELSIQADLLYQYSKIIEFKLNFSDKNPDSNRIDKIKSIYSKITTYSLTNDSICDENMNINKEFDSHFMKILEDKHVESMFRKEKIEEYKNSLKNNTNIINKLTDFQHSIKLKASELKKSLEKPAQILIDNKGDEPRFYVKYSDN